MTRITKSKADRNEQRRNKRRLNRLNSSKPPRSPNRFILYRKYKQNEFFNDPSNSISMRELSKVIAKMWENEPSEVKNYWDQVSEREKLKSSSSFNAIPGPADILTSNDDMVTFVNTTTLSTETHQKNYTINNISENFIFESSESIAPESSASSIDPMLPLCGEYSYFSEYIDDNNPLCMYELERSSPGESHEFDEFKFSDDLFNI
jgi:hypothetical protein